MNASRHFCLQLLVAQRYDLRVHCLPWYALSMLGLGLLYGVGAWMMCLASESGPLWLHACLYLGMAVIIFAPWCKRLHETREQEAQRYEQIRRLFCWWYGEEGGMYGLSRLDADIEELIGSKWRHALGDLFSRTPRNPLNLPQINHQKP